MIGIHLASVNAQDREPRNESSPEAVFIVSYELTELMIWFQCQIVDPPDTNLAISRKSSSTL